MVTGIAAVMEGDARGGAAPASGGWPGHAAGRLAEAVSRAFSPFACTLPEAFFPAHLSVALVDAVFAPAPACGYPPGVFAARYCRRFGLERVRADRWNAPPAMRRRGSRTSSGAMGGWGARDGGRGVWHALPGAGHGAFARAMGRRGGRRTPRRRRRRAPEGALAAAPGGPRGAARRARRRRGRVAAVSYVHGRRRLRARRRCGALVRRCAHEPLHSPRYVDARIRGEVP